MIDHDPPITRTARSRRVREEQRMVQVRAFLYAASREADNDFHFIIGRDPAQPSHVYMAMEVSGLPGRRTPAFRPLQAARTAFQEFFGDELPGPTYDYYDPPIPVLVVGALFFDMSHAKGQPPGPRSLREDIPTIWEVHPLARIVLEPGDDAAEGGSQPESAVTSARPGLPDPTAVIGERAFPSPTGQLYRIIETDERDPYDPPPDPSDRR